MSLNRFLFLLSFSILGGQIALQAQPYTAFGYANGVVGARYQMPGTTITEESGLEVNQTGVVTGYYYDVANESGPDFDADKDVVFGLFEGNANDGGGLDKRGYDTKSDAANAALYAPIRWNGGSNLWRQSGQWVRYSIDFDKETYNFCYRANTNGFATGAHKFVLKIMDAEDISEVIFERNIDLSGSFPAVGTISENILRLGGGGNDETEWFKVLDEIDIPTTGTYVVELSSPEAVYTYSSWGVFTFNIAAGYKAKPYNGSAWIALQDTVKAWQYDKVGESNQFHPGDSGVTVGLYNPSKTAAGSNMRQYTDNPTWDAARWNATPATFQANGGWYKYTFNFEGRNPYFFCFRGVPQFGQASWKGTVQILQPDSDLLIEEFSFDDSVKYVSDGDAGESTRWMYISIPKMIPEGTYIVKIDLPNENATGILGDFTFIKDNPQNVNPQVITYNWPESVRTDPDLFSDLYEVKVTQGVNEYTLFTHNVIPDLRPSAYPDDNGGNGVLGALTDRSFVFSQFAFTGEIDVEATKVFGTPADRVEIQPKAYGINPYFFDGRTVKFKLMHQENRPSYISINFVSDDNTDDLPGDHTAPKHGLMLFADKPEVFKPDTTTPGTVIFDESLDSATVVNANLIYFPAGDYDLKQVFNRGVIDLTKDNQQVYLEGGAFVRGSVWSHGHDNIWLYGRGIFTGWDFLFHELLNENGAKEAYMAFHNSDNCHIEGIVITDPCHHSIPTGNNTYFKNLKVIGWAYNQDGIRAGAGTYAEEMFFKTEDDRDYANRDHIMKNSVLWPMRNGAFGILGWQNFDGGRTTYDNLYFINSEWERPEDKVGNQGVIGSNCVQGANLANDTIRNLSLEDYTTILCILRIRDDYPLHPFDPENPGSIKEFLFENIKVEQPFTTSKGVQKYQRIEGYERDGVRPSIHDITFRNLIVAGELILDHNKDKYFVIDEDVAYNIFFEAMGEIHTIAATYNDGGNVYPSGNISVPDGTDQYVTIEPKPGYRIKNVVVDHNPVGPLQVISLRNVTSDHRIEVEFEAGENSFSLTEVIDPNTVLTDTIDLGIDPVGHPTLQIDKPAALMVYPNPTRDAFTVDGIEAGTMIRLYNQVGQLVLESDHRIIQVSGIGAGIYIVEADGRFAKIVIQ